MVFSTSKLQSLSIRPPTPPKDLQDNDHEILDFLDDPFGTKAPVAKVIAAKSLLNTPEQSPSSGSDLSSSSTRRKKRVNFELQICTIPEGSPTEQLWTPRHSSPLRPLPQTRVSKPLKSILKPCDATSTPPAADGGAAAYQFKSFAEMLESIVKQLASPARSSRFDAYHSLQRTMQAYEKIPDTQALVDKMGLLMQFIRRDMQAIGVNGTGLDSQLIGQALKFLMALVRIPAVRSAMDDDFCSFIVDRTIQVAADAEMPKTIVNTHLALLMQQNFRPKTMTIARVERILDVLDGIHERVSGYSVLAYRIRIYRKFIQQRPDIMTKHTERWFKNTAKALLAGQKDINQSALDTALSAAKAIGTDRHVVKSVLSILNRQKSDGETFANVMAKELEKMLGSENPVIVPQIWSAVTSLLLGSLQGHMFIAMGDWLKVFEKCLSSPNDLVKLHTNIAFGFLLYTVNISEDTPGNWSKMFASIPLHQLQRRGPWKKTEREAATSGYFTLLYYAFRPLASQKQLDRYWTQFVADFWNPLVHSSSLTHAFAACRVVSALLQGSRKPWNEQRALDLRPHAMVQREELPLLDPKWVRKSLSLVLKFVETLLDATPWAPDEIKDEPVKTMWLSLLNSLIEASSKEVMASTESKDAMAHIVNLLRRVWDRHAAQLALSQQTEDNWADKFCFLLETVVQKLGALHFADKCLMRNGEDEFEVASTPSHRSRQQGPRISPLLYFVDLLVNQSEGKLSDSVRLRAMKLLIEPCLESQNTRLSRLELLRDCSAVVDPSSRAMVTFNFWAQIANLTKACIQEQPSDSNERVSRQLGREYDVIVEILSSGSSYLLNRPRGQEVLVSFADTVRREAGEGALVLAVIEKVSECVVNRAPEEDKAACLPFVSILLRNRPKIIVRRTIEQGRQNLWPSSPNPGRNPDFDPYNHLYAAVVSVSAAAYRECGGEDIDKVRDLLSAMVNSIHQCPIALLAVYLRKIQEAIRLWVEDPDRKLQKKDEQIKVLHLQVVSLWKEVCAAIERLPRRDSQILLHLESLITPGFLSRRRGIVNMSVATWNATFGKEETLSYPARLEEILRRLRNTVELSLPSLEVRDEGATTEPSFYDSDDSAVVSGHHLQSPRVKESPFKIVKSTRKSRSPALSSTSSRRIAPRPTPKVRLRHDNSQIQFEPIVSSPTDPFNQESQILTERQKEMIERQGITRSLFANMGSTSSPSRPEAAMSMPSPLELHSDPLSVDDLPTEKSRTPLKTLPSLGPMDVFLGSSPTPQARNRSQQVVSDGTSVATPTAMRTVRLQPHAEELGSSPPRFQRDPDAQAAATKSNDTTENIVSDSFEYRQPERSYSISFDDGTTANEHVLSSVLGADTPGKEAVQDVFTSEADASEMPSSTIDLQLTAQIDADIQAQMKAVANRQSEDAVGESESVFVDAASHQLPEKTVEFHARSDTEVDDTQPLLPAPVEKQPLASGTSSTSRVGDSFSSQVAETETSQIQQLRRSARHSATSSLSRPASVKKRRGSTGRGLGRPKKIKAEDAEEEPVRSLSQSIPDADGMFDNIVVASPAASQAPTRKTRSSSQARIDSDVVVPETTRKRGVRRSASLLSHVETHSQDVVVDDTPALKRARRSNNQDVSEAKTSPPKESRAAQVKRLKHVRVTPKRSFEASSSVRASSAAAGEKRNAGQQAAGEPVPPVGEQNANVAQQPVAAARETEHSQQASAVSTPSRSFTERVILTPRSIINQLKHLKDALFRSSQLVLGRQEEREIDDALFDIRREVHAAGRRGEHDQ